MARYLIRPPHRPSYTWSTAGLKRQTAIAQQIRNVLFDCRKAFDLIDHRIVVDKLCKLVLKTTIINWIIDFLSGRSQRIKRAEGCYSKWDSVPSGVPQGTNLGPH